MAGSKAASAQKMRGGLKRYGRMMRSVERRDRFVGGLARDNWEKAGDLAGISGDTWARFWLPANHSESAVPCSAEPVGNPALR